MIFFSKQESEVINKMIHSKRQGPAFGYVDPHNNFDHNPKSLSSMTQHDSRLLLLSNPSSEHTNCSVYYRNNDGDKKSFHSVYSDGMMRRMTKKQKKKEIISNNILQMITIEEMKSRILAMAIMIKFGLVPEQHQDSFLYGLEESLKASIYKNIFSDLSTFDNALLIWSYTTGEMQNHQALCVHKDTNRSHIAETMTLWNRWTEGMIPDGNNDFDGKLMFPWHRFGIKIKCGVDVIHSNFSSTYHVSDASRNTVNWSRVHGPK